VTATSWSTGKVGMTGTSYGGTLALAAAVTGVKGLEAIIPIAPNTSYYHYYRSNGLVRHPGGWLGEDIDFLYDFINSGETTRRELCNRMFRDGIMAAGRYRTSGDYNDFWATRDLLPLVGKVRAATLIAHAFNDWNVVPEHSVRIYEALKKRKIPLMAYYHQGGHGGAPPLEMRNKWFSRFLFGIENGVENEARAWIVREGANAQEPVPYDDYPNPAAKPVRLVPQSGGTTRGGLVLTVKEGPQQTETLIDDVQFSGGQLAQMEQSSNRLIYATPELLEPIHLSGYSTVTLRVSSNKPAANLSVWLVELPWTGAPNGTNGLITRGWADPQNWKSLTESGNYDSKAQGKPLEPGRFVTLTFNLQPDDQIVAKGKRIGLMIMSSDRDFTLWPKAGTELTVDVSQSSIVLPVVGGESALRKAITVE
jgi:X-Pro dipeptidyl-peptidase